MDYTFWDDDENSWRNRERMCWRPHLEGQFGGQGGMFSTGEGRGRERDLQEEGKS